MYKTKLQQLCHKKRWDLPEYSYVKEGPDHSPSFTASVVVNGVTFETTNDFTSSKDAQNDAARLAVHHLTNFKLIGETETGRPGTEIHQAGKLQSNANEFKNDEINQYKLMQQTYAQRNKLGMPVYSEEINQYKLMLQIYAQRNKLDIHYVADKKGPPHAPCFKAKVYVEGHPYESPGSYKTLKEAEHAAAQVALLSFTADTFQENDSLLYKNILQELAQSEGFILPIYKTEYCGEIHNPSFISTVEVEGETFRGTTAKSKKQAESNAARAAYTAFMERKRSRTANSSSSSLDYEALEVKPGSVFPTFVNAHENLIKSDPLHLTQNVNYRKQRIQEKDDYEECPTEITPPDLSSLSIGGPNLKKSNGIDSYLLNNRFRVYTSIPDIDFPNGTVLLPIAEDQWVAVSLELPN